MFLSVLSVSAYLFTMLQRLDYHEHFTNITIEE